MNPTLDTTHYEEDEIMTSMTEKAPTWLLEHRNNVYSQSGEDGVIEKILETLPEKDNWCVEFGAWDGVFLSNSCNLIKQHAYHAVMIEGDEEKYQDLLNSYKDNDKVICLNKFVGFEEEDGLDILLSETPIPLNFDFLSIDIDGNDYHVWKNINKYRPKLVCIEFNHTIPNESKFVQNKDPSIHQGCSIKALIELGKEKGYEAVSILTANVFFIRSDYFDLFGIQDNSVEALRIDLKYITQIYFGYDGRVILEGFKKLPWHNLDLYDEDFQQLPAFFQQYPEEYSPLIKRLFYYRYIRFSSIFRQLKKIPILKNLI